MKRLGLFALVAVAACGPPPNLLPQDDLNRPTDVVFMCFGAFPLGTGTDAGVPDGGPDIRTHAGFFVGARGKPRAEALSGLVWRLVGCPVLAVSPPLVRGSVRVRT